jgi:hypothetical protein
MQEGTPSTGGSALGLLPALERLDALLLAAADRAEAVFGPGGAADARRGPVAGRGDMARLWERSVAEPLFPPGAGLPVGHGPAPTWLAAAFGLSGFDLDVLVMAVAPELDLRYEPLYGYLQDDVRRRRPTVDLALNLLCADAVERIGARSRFAPDAPLVRDRLLTVVGEPGESLLNRSLVPDEQVLRLLIGESTLDPRLAGFAELTRASGSPADLALAPVTRRALPPADAPRPRLYLEGEPASGRAEVAAALAAERGLPLLTVDLSQAAAGREPVAEVVRVAFRESWFRGTALLLTGVTDLPADDDTALARAMADSRVPVFLAGEKPWRPDPPAGGTAVVPFPSPTARGCDTPPDMTTRRVAYFWMRQRGRPSRPAGSPVPGGASENPAPYPA